MFGALDDKRDRDRVASVCPDHAGGDVLAEPVATAHVSGASLLGDGYAAPLRPRAAPGALHGGVAALARFHSALLLELVAGHLARAGDRPEDALALLAPLGYHAARIAGAALTPVEVFAGDGDYLFALALR